MTDSLEDFLSSNSDARVNTGGRSCICCANEKLAADVVAYLDKLASGKTEIPITYFHERYVIPTYDQPRQVNSLYRHVRRCLKRDRITGDSLNGNDE